MYYQAANIKKPHDIRTSKLCKQLLTDNYVTSESKFLSVFLFLFLDEKQNIGIFHFGGFLVWYTMCLQCVVSSSGNWEKWVQTRGKPVL